MTAITIPFSPRTVAIPCDGGETELDFPHPVMASGTPNVFDLAVYLRRDGIETELVPIVDYTVAGVGDQEGVVVTLVDPALAGDLYVIDGERTPARVTNHENHRSLSSTFLNDELNRQIILLQEARRNFDRALKRQPTAQPADGGWDFQGFQAVNLAPGTQPNDAVTLAQLQAAAIDASGIVALREVLTGNRTYYVRTDGDDDENDGLLDADVGAFATLAKAFAVVARLDFAGYTVTIQAGDEGEPKTFSSAGPAIVGPLTGGGILRVRGRGHDQTLVSTTGDTFWVLNAGSVTVKFGAMKATSSGGNILKVNYQSLVAVEDDFDFGAAGGFQVWTHDNQACFQILGTGYRISGNAQAHLFIQNGSHVFIEDVELDLIGTPVFSLCFAYGYVRGSLQWIGNTVTGTATGRRYIEYRGSTIGLNGLGENVLPGSVFGLTDYRECLTANRTFYVRSDGDNANSGGNDNADGAFATWQRAVDVISRTLDLNGFTVTIQHGNEAGTVTFPAGVLVTGFGSGGTIKFRGNGDTTVISTTGACFNLSATGDTAIVLENMKAESSAGSIITAAYGCVFSIGAGFNFGAAASGYHMHLHDGRAIGQILSVSYKISGGAIAHVFCQNGGHAYIESATLNISGTPDFSSAFFLAFPRGSLQYISNTVVGSATGKRYDGYFLSLVNLNGAAETVLPGDAAGSVDASSVAIAA